MKAVWVRSEKRMHMSIIYFELHSYNTSSIKMPHFCFSVKLPAASCGILRVCYTTVWHHSSAMLRTVWKLGLRQKKASRLFIVMQVWLSLINQHANNDNSLHLCRSFPYEAQCVLKYDSVNSKCTPVIRKDAGLINSVLWMRKLTMPSVDGKILQCTIFNILSYCVNRPW